MYVLNPFGDQHVFAGAYTKILFPISIRTPLSPLPLCRCRPVTVVGTLKEKYSRWESIRHCQQHRKRDTLFDIITYRAVAARWSRLGLGSEGIGLDPDCGRTTDELLTGVVVNTRRVPPRAQPSPRPWWSHRAGRPHRPRPHGAGRRARGSSPFIWSMVMNDAGGCATTVIYQRTVRVPGAAPTAGRRGRPPARERTGVDVGELGLTPPSARVRRPSRRGQRGGARDGHAACALGTREVSDSTFTTDSKEKLTEDVYLRIRAVRQEKARLKVSVLCTKAFEVEARAPPPSNRCSILETSAKQLWPCEVRRGCMTAQAPSCIPTELSSGYLSGFVQIVVGHGLQLKARRGAELRAGTGIESKIDQSRRFFIEYSRGKQTGERSKGRWSPPPMDTCNLSVVSSTWPASRTETLVGGNRSTRGSETYFSSDQLRDVRGLSSELDPFQFAAPVSFDVCPTSPIRGRTRAKQASKGFS
ncbi:hypothetical protein EVAR_49388_1 [Eumeta japonica]|uniref:Uncharacterized protein n=1 Tax=Eumeta variegata TaxID=151549 RepID=A0A4C1YPW0_EUMVA|nr:hypothetical protein EVAR_49388_1 [Eumeta japonica]